jgi:hypothetical protein
MSKSIPSPACLLVACVIAAVGCSKSHPKREPAASESITDQEIASAREGKPKRDEAKIAAKPEGKETAAEKLPPEAKKDRTKPRRDPEELPISEQNKIKFYLNIYAESKEKSNREEMTYLRSKIDYLSPEWIDHIIGTNAADFDQHYANLGLSLPSQKSENASHYERMKLEYAFMGRSERFHILWASSLIRQGMTNHSQVQAMKEQHQFFFQKP